MSSPAQLHDNGRQLGRMLGTHSPQNTIEASFNLRSCLPCEGSEDLKTCMSGADHVLANKWVQPRAWQATAPASSPYLKLHLRLSHHHTINNTTPRDIRQSIANHINNLTHQPWIPWPTLRSLPNLAVAESSTLLAELRGSQHRDTT